MSITSKRIVLNNKTMEVISVDEYYRLLELNSPIFDDTCVEFNGYVYPITKSVHMEMPSVYSNGTAMQFNMPEDTENKDEYKTENIIDFSSGRLNGMKDYMDKIDRLKSMESSRLSTIKHVLTIPINEGDAPELKALKEIINEKHIDADVYKQKFPSGSDYNNDLRHMKSPDNNNISFFKAKRVANAFDIEMELILRDKTNAVNPSGKTYNVILTEED